MFQKFVPERSRRGKVSPKPAGIRRRLRAGGASNAYWLTASGAAPDYAAVGDLRRRPEGRAALDGASCVLDAAGATVVVTVAAVTLLLDARFSVEAAGGGAALWPLIAEAPPPVLLRPGGRATTTLKSRSTDRRLRVRLDAFNLAAPVFADLACLPR